MGRGWCNLSSPLLGGLEEPLWLRQVGEPFASSRSRSVTTSGGSFVGSERRRQRLGLGWLWAVARLWELPCGARPGGQRSGKLHRSVLREAKRAGGGAGAGILTSGCLFPRNSFLCGTSPAPLASARAGAAPGERTARAAGAEPLLAGRAAWEPLPGPPRARLSPLLELERLFGGSKGVNGEMRFLERFHGDGGSGSREVSAGRKRHPAAAGAAGGAWGRGGDRGSDAGGGVLSLPL